MAFIKGCCHDKIWRYQLLKQEWKLHFWNRIHISQGPMNLTYICPELDVRVNEAYGLQPGTWHSEYVRRKIQKSQITKHGGSVGNTLRWLRYLCRIWFGLLRYMNIWNKNAYIHKHILYEENQMRRGGKHNTWWKTASWWLKKFAFYTNKSLSGFMRTSISKGDLQVRCTWFSWNSKFKSW